jgi:hypothetical protein
MKQRREKMKKKAIILGLVLSVGIFVSTIPADAGFSHNGVNPNGMGRNGLLPTPGLDFTTISHQGLGK